MKIEFSVEELNSVLEALTLALTCANDYDYLYAHNSDVRKKLKNQVLFLDTKLKITKK